MAKTTKKQASSARGRRKHIKDDGAYFNKNNRYKSGKFLSAKNKTEIMYRSSFEYYYMQILENDKDVIAYVSEPLAIKYIDSDGMSRLYFPDILILYKDGGTELVEVKPKEMTKAQNVRRKAHAAKLFLNKYYPDTKFRFVTEDDIFENANDYKLSLRKMA